MSQNRVYSKQSLTFYERVYKGDIQHKRIQRIHALNRER